MHFMEVATLNAHEIAVCGRGQLVRDVGQAVEPTFVLTNHSCDPSILKVNVGSATAAFACRDIKEGEEVSVLQATVVFP